MGVARCSLGPRERGARHLRPEATHRDAGDHQLVGSPRRGRKGRGVKLNERALSFVDAPDQEEAPDLEIPRVGGVDAIAVLFERRARSVERPCGPAQIPRTERDLGLGNHAPCSGHDLSRAEGTHGATQENLCSNEIAELSHRDASKRESGRVVAQGDPLQCAQGITRSECTRRGSDQRVHRNPVTLVTPTRSISGLKFIS